jgi:SAM-dependent methyltransferase
VDWADGAYEVVARQLAPASADAVAACQITSGATVLDLGCGTGNATELLARLGCDVFAVDPTSRLRELASARLSSAGLGARFLDGVAEKIPLGESSVDAIVSVFAAIFTSDPPGAAAEMSRVLRPTGRISLTAWIPEGPLFRLGAIRRDAVATALGRDAGPLAPFPWHDSEFVAGLFSSPDFSMRTLRSSISFVAESVDGFLSEEISTSPIWIDARRIIEPTGGFDRLMAESRDALLESNETTEGFKATSPFAIHVIDRRIGGAS